MESRWHNIDPASTEYFDISPNVYVANNPAIFIDPDGKRFYFAAGAGHDPSNTGYISMMINAFRIAGIQNPVEIYAHGSRNSDVLFTNGVNKDIPYYDQQPLYSGQNIAPGDPTMLANYGGISMRQDAKPNSRITDAVAAIMEDLKRNPLEEGEQFNLSGYSTGSVVMAQAALC